MFYGSNNEAEVETPLLRSNEPQRERSFLQKNFITLIVLFGCACGFAFLGYFFWKPTPQLFSSEKPPINEPRESIGMNVNWKFMQGSNIETCPNTTFPNWLNDTQCPMLNFQGYVISQEGCRQVCCSDPTCQVWQWCPKGAACSPENTCWTGPKIGCYASQGWISSYRDKLPTSTPPPPQCALAECSTQTSDDSWQSVDLPHDFVVLGNFSQYADLNHGYLPFSMGWYRYHFTIPADWEGRVIWIEIEGTQRDTILYLNNQLLGTHLSGYTPYRFYIHSFANIGAENLLAIHVDATHPDSWWYDGGGIYRHVWLNSAHPLHIATYGVYLPSNVNTSSITRSGDSSFAMATILPQLTLYNTELAQVNCTVSMKMYEKDSGRWVASISVPGVIVNANTTQTIVAPTITLGRVRLWSVVDPFLYLMHTEVSIQGTVVDRSENTFGVRSIRWDAATGFYLNEVNMKIQGMANHQDFCGVGVAVPDSLQVYRVAKMKEMGANAWRTAHNPPNIALLDECDRQGLMVWDENHRNEINGQNWLDDLKTLILRDRNHPSVIMWSICNEVLCQGFNSTSGWVLKDLIKQYDPLGNRPVSAAMNGDFGSDFRQVLDVMGMNYFIGQYDSVHQANTSQPLIASETSSAVSDRSIYFNNETLAYVSAYDTNYPSWGNSAEDAWCAVAERDFMSGEFVWTGFDYKGEPTPYQWPNINSHFGVIDICGFPKDNYFYYQSVWLTRQTPILHIFPQWNWTPETCIGGCTVTPDGGMVVNVWAYTNGDSVELFLNGDSLGVQNVPKCRHASWNVTYIAGELSAKAYLSSDPSTAFATDAIYTTSSPFSLSIEMEFPKTPILIADNSDVALFTIKVLDSNNYFVSTANLNITFTLTGNGKIIGVGNGDPSSHEPDYPSSPTLAQRSTWNGLARVIVQSTFDAGAITIFASSPNLKSASFVFASK